MLSFKNIKAHKTFTIAHRGASMYEHENTIDAFQKAIDLQADAIELDVRRTKDDVLVVHHNAFLKGVIKPIAEMNFSEIEAFNNQSSYKVPTLESVLTLCKNKIALDIELKEFGYEQSVVKLSLRYFDSANLLFTSFKKKSLEAINRIDKNLSTGYLFHKPLLLKSIPLIVNFVFPHKALCKVGFIKKLEKLGKPIIIWTVDKQKTKDKFRKHNIFALITNDPIKMETDYE